MMSRWRAALEKTHGRSVAHKTLRVWRSLWTIMQGMKVAHGADPSRGVRNRAPAPRHQRWTEGEAVRLVKGAWRHGYRGLACIIAVAWDTQFSPLTFGPCASAIARSSGGRLIFDRQADGRAKTGRAAIGTLSRRTERLVSEYLGRDRSTARCVLFRMRGGLALSGGDTGARLRRVARDRVPRRRAQADGHAAKRHDRGGGRRRRCGRNSREDGELHRPIERAAQDLLARQTSRRCANTDEARLTRAPQDARRERKRAKVSTAAVRRSITWRPREAAK